jgi:hypothetical protein
VKRSLTLNRETLIELSDESLGSVQGAQAIPSGLTCPVVACVSDRACDITFQPRCFAE